MFQILINFFSLIFFLIRGNGDVGLNSRFGEDEPPKTVSQTTSIHGSGGHFTQTTHNFGPNGQHTSHTSSGKL